MACAWLLATQECSEIPPPPAWLAQGAGGSAQLPRDVDGKTESPPGSHTDSHTAVAEGLPSPSRCAGDVTPARWEAVARLALSELSLLTSSAGRLFDAIAALCGLRASVTYEGQAAIELESAVDRSEHGEYTIALRRRDRALELDPCAAISAIVRERELGTSVGVMAARFHNGLARATARACRQIADERDLSLAVLSGGVFQNRALLELTVAELKRTGLRPLIPHRLPPGDGGISYGQAAVATARLCEDWPSLKR